MFIVGGFFKDLGCYFIFEGVLIVFLWMVGVILVVLFVCCVKVEVNEFGDIEIFFNEFSMVY